jgi:uncharacterized iron-regulated membrane protein
VGLHRWAGLAMAGFLVIVGATGSVLAFRDEIDVWINPDLLTVAARDAAALDPLELRERAAALYPGARIDDASLEVEPGRAYMARVWTKGEGESAALIFVHLDPYTGERLGTRTWGVVSLDRTICSSSSIVCTTRSPCRGRFTRWRAALDIQPVLDVSGNR